MIKIDGEKTRTVKVGEPLTLVAWVTDDGVPKPRSDRRRSGSARSAALRQRVADRAAQSRRCIPPSRVTVGKRIGLHLSWFVYRGDGNVRFEPDAGQGVGGHAHRRQLAMGAALDPAAGARRTASTRRTSPSTRPAPTCSAPAPTMAHCSATRTLTVTVTR